MIQDLRYARHVIATLMGMAIFAGIFLCAGNADLGWAIGCGLSTMLGLYALPLLKSIVP